MSTGIGPSDTVIISRAILDTLQAEIATLREALRERSRAGHDDLRDLWKGQLHNGPWERCDRPPCFADRQRTQEEKDE